MSYMSWKGEMFIEYSLSALKYISVSGGGGGRVAGFQTLPPGLSPPPPSPQQT